MSRALGKSLANMEIENPSGNFMGISVLFSAGFFESSII
jgi:hypothetical protein